MDSPGETADDLPISRHSSFSFEEYFEELSMERARELSSSFISAPSDLDAEMGGQDPRAAGLGPAQASHGQPRPTSSEDTNPLRQHDADPFLSADAFSYSFVAPSNDCFPQDGIFDLHSVNFFQYPSTYNYAFPNEDGGGSMAVAPSNELLHHVSPQYDTPDALASPAPDKRIPDMAAATSDASAMPALGGEIPPANHDLMDNSLTNGLRLLDTPIDFAQSNNLNGADMSGMPMDMNSAFPPMNPFMPPTTNERLTAFARLRFDDGSYYMHTYQITLGRNLDLAHRDMKRLIKAEALHKKGHVKAANEHLHGLDEVNGKKDKKKKRKGDRRGARSVISEKGGILSAPIESMPMEYQQRRQSNASHSLSSNSHPTGESGEEKPAERAPQDMIMQAFPEVPAQFDGHVPEDPNDCPFVPIHPQQIMAKTGSLGPKGISREHAKIFFDFDAGHFCIKVLGNNGLHHEGEFYPRGETIPLDHGDHLQLGAVNIHFFLPDVALTEQQRHRQESGSRPMSFSFENGNGQLESDEHISSESEDQQSVNPRHVYYHHPVSDSDDDDGLADEEMDDYEEPAPKPRQKTSLKLKIKNLPPAPSKESKKAHKRKHQHRELTPEEPPTKKVKLKVKDTAKLKEAIRESAKEPKVQKERREPKEPKEPKEKEVAVPEEPKKPKEPKEPKEKGKAPAKTPAKAPVKSETPVEEPVKDIPAAPKPEQPSKPPPNDTAPVLRKPHEGELEAGGDIDGLITEEMAIQHNLPRNLIGHVVEKRKGPGRPPKDGIMSKRQRSQLIKQAKDIERARAAGIDPADIPIPISKPKAPKRKESNAGDGEDDAVIETTEQGDGGLSGLHKQTKPIRPPRTPSPEMRIEDYSEEQLQRPTANYVVLIHEAISSSPTGQMNLQSIYTYIERKYPWYKFKTTTSGWQSSVRHNLGQHDAFMKGDKEGKGYLWRINPEVSIEKERRKRQASPPLNHAPRPPYYQPPNGYQPYPQPGYGYHPGMPHAMPQPPPRLPPSLSQPRLPPSMTRNEGNSAASATPQNAPHPSPYASPWGGGGNTAGSPPAPNPPRPYPQPNPQAPPASSAAGSSGQYGVLYPTAAPQQSPYSGPSAPSPYGGPYANAGASPYGPAPPRPYAAYPPQGQQSNAPSASQPQSSASPYGPPPPQAPSRQGSTNDTAAPHPSGRYPIGVHPELIRQLEAYRKTYLEQCLGPEEQKKVDNAIRACVDRTVPESTLTEPERKLLISICGVESINKYVKRAPDVKDEDEASTAAAFAAAGAAANTVSQQYHPPPQAAHPTGSASPAPPRENSEPHKFTPNMTGASPSTPTAATPSTAAPAPPVAAMPSHRPSVEPITPVPGSPAVQTGTPMRRPMTELTADSTPDADEAKKPEENQGAPKKTD
ncbi:uncharacterized protein J4E84_001665 [Alternaria hordeiaustralica]|uniref:uncharacterized protein n=1 Tax=Alternaria hordeiaustralica TaxID=1187925 RepID=UPI0020C50A18|nr:uncharacterized protein J4E84_001665 [Alternaria hordeiaustralica]KAI4695041.1 hypothetical protein J4E84_001665 [Alternaria hordeiaustralica]